MQTKHSLLQYNFVSISRFSKPSLTFHFGGFHFHGTKRTIFFPSFWYLPLCCLLCFRSCFITGLAVVSAMATKIKGICKSFKYISKIFVVKEREMEIGHPTDVKHVAHIGWDDPSGSAPSWMNEFKVPCDGERRDSNSMALSTWSSQDFEQCTEAHGRSGDMFDDIRPKDLPKKHRRKKSKSTSSPKSSTSRSAKPKAKYSNIERPKNVV